MPAPGEEGRRDLAEGRERRATRERAERNRQRNRQRNRDRRGDRRADADFPPFGFRGEDRGGDDSGVDDDELGLADFKSALAEFNPQFFDAVDPLARRLVTGIAEGGGRDTAFQMFQEAQLGQFGRQRQFQTGQLQTQLGRQGIGGSAAINELNRLNLGFEGREASLVGQLGLQQLGRSDQAIGQLQGFREAELSGISTGLQNLLAIPTLQVAQTAAEAAGEDGDDGGGGLFGGLLDQLI